MNTIFFHIVRKTVNSILPLCLLISLPLFFSCSSDEETWKPGPKTKDGCQQVHFSGENPSIAFASADGFDVIVKRTITTGNLTVPVKVISASEGVIIPPSVTFNDGSDEAYLNIQVPATATTGDSFNFELKLEGDEVDPYADLDGTSYYKGFISFAKHRRAQVYISGYDRVLGRWAEDLYDLGGGTFLINDFMRSSVNLLLTVDKDNYVVVSPYNCSPYLYTADYGDFIYLHYWSDRTANVFNPWGDDFDVNVTTMTIFNGAGNYRSYGQYHEQTATTGEYFVLTLGSFQTTADASAKSYVYMYIRPTADGVDPVIIKP